MKRKISLTVFMMMLISVVAMAQKADIKYAPGFRYAPDRDFDIAWENDLVAFRVYGLQPNADDGLSGVDCWHKKVSYPILDKWYKANTAKTGYYHIEHGEGCDQYHVGKTRGCGGLGIWKNEEILRSGLYESWEVVSQTQTAISFKLVYSWTIDGERIVETRVITLENGSQLYTANSSFTKNGFPIEGLEIAIGLSTQNAIADVTFNEKEGWMSAWHTMAENPAKIGTGVLVDTRYLIKMFEQKSKEKDSSHALAIMKTDGNGSIKYSAGFAWEAAGKIKSHKEWNAYLNDCATH